MLVCIQKKNFLCVLCIPNNDFVYPVCIPRTVVPATVHKASKFGVAAFFPTRKSAPPSPCIACGPDRPVGSG